jgi:hypothetical protein
LLRADREAADGEVEWQIVVAEAVESFANEAALSGAVDEAPVGVFLTEHDVVFDAQVFGQV